MTRHEHVLAALLAEGGGLIVRRQHPELAGSIDWALRCGRLQALLPGVYGRPEEAAEIGARSRAVGLWDRDAVLLGRAAARLTFWPSLRVDSVEVSTRRRPSPTTGYSFTRRSVPPELVIENNGLRLTCPALTALLLCEAMGGDGIDQVLRSRSATLDDLRRASGLAGHRRGHALVRRLLHESRDEPWSGGERELHRLLRVARITGWRANHRISIGHLTFYLDVAFPLQRLALEVDGRIHRDDPAVFENDRTRQNWLVLAGWRILRFTWPMLSEHPTSVVSTIREGLAIATPAAGRPESRLRRLSAAEATR